MFTAGCLRVDYCRLNCDALIPGREPHPLRPRLIMISDRKLLLFHEENANRTLLEWAFSLAGVNEILSVTSKHFALPWDLRGLFQRHG
ncbi:hypothetical protein CEXT_158681 [Caerostris extrusa]|uniref:Uncharacterized protein n=1 Tax=Caerostris extrusa TaxID=172846 RepID=A0AAV4UKB9_CAEEX|nr:hypothetical protein CEXT_158681 [Caerostris extrusa]